MEQDGRASLVWRQNLNWFQTSAAFESQAQQTLLDIYDENIQKGQEGMHEAFFWCRNQGWFSGAVTRPRPPKPNLTTSDSCGWRRQQPVIQLMPSKQNAVRTVATAGGGLGSSRADRRRRAFELERVALRSFLEIWGGTFERETSKNVL